MKNVLTAFTLVFLSVVIVFGALELYVRLTQNDGENFDIEMWRYARELKRVSDIEGMGHEHIPGTKGTYMGVPVEINSVGWRDRDYSLEKPEGTVRIMMLGDSLTFGWGAPAKGVTSHVLEERLALQGTRPYEVLNTGIGNSNSAMQVAYFMAEGYKFDPDIVVLNYFINDAEPTPVRKNNALMERSYAAVFLAGRWDLLMRTLGQRRDWQDYYRELYGPDQAGWQATQDAFEALAAFCAENGIALAVVNYPELHSLDPYPFVEVSEQIGALAAAQGLPFLDLVDSVRPEEPMSLWVTPTDAHPNAKAAERYGPAIAAFLAEAFPQKF